MFETLEHQVFADDNFPYHSASELLPFTVSKLVRLSIFMKFLVFADPGQKETPLIRLESCCVSSHFFRLIWTLIWHVLAKLILSGNSSGVCPVSDVHALSMGSMFTVVSQGHTRHSMSID